MIGYDKLQKALKHLELQFQNYRSAKDRPKLTVLDREGLSESVIQRFETCYDTLWKDVKRYLIEELGLTDVPSSPKPILKLAGQNGLLASSVERWLDYANARTDTAHDYSGEKAAATLALVEDFLKDSVNLYQTMSGNTWR